jgi:DNA-binding LacI/PurR family transcriptional regulator
MSKNLSRIRPTISDVAELAGVSIATVSRVLNDPTVVADVTVERVQDAIGALNYRPHAAARVLASRKTKTIGLMLHEISGSFFPPMLAGIETGAREHGYDLLIHATPIQDTKQHLPPALGEHNTAGLLIFTDSIADEEIGRLHNLGFPQVLLHRSAPEGLDIPCVTFENKAGARKLVDYLIEQRGYRRIAFLKGPEGNEDSFWRETGYRESLENHHLPVEPELIGFGGFHGEEAAHTIETWLKQGLDVEAIFAGDDESAAGVVTALHAAGLKIPEDIAVVGFDDVPLSRYLTPALTTVRAPIKTAGYEAARQLINLIEVGEAEPLILLPTHVIIRRSCGNTEEEEVVLGET